MTEPKIVATVLEILDQAAKFIGKYEEESFSQNMFSQLIESDMESPLEQVMQIAFATVSKINWLDYSEPLDDCRLMPGLYICPQYVIGPYKADFYLEWLKWIDKDTGAKMSRNVVVECDGTAFHERTELERRNEKRRDRYMQKMGLKVFRYTGKEILQDPYKVAVEVLGYLTDDEKNTVTPQEYFA